jgi:hypothetical protein
MRPPNVSSEGRFWRTPTIATRCPVTASSNLRMGCLDGVREVPYAASCRDARYVRFARSRMLSGRPSRASSKRRSWRPPTASNARAVSRSVGRVAALLRPSCRCVDRTRASQCRCQWIGSWDPAGSAQPVNLPAASIVGICNDDASDCATTRCTTERPCWTPCPSDCPSKARDSVVLEVAQQDKDPG